MAESGDHELRHVIDEIANRDAALLPPLTGRFGPAEREHSGAAYEERAQWVARHGLEGAYRKLAAANLRRVFAAQLVGERRTSYFAQAYVAPDVVVDASAATDETVRRGLQRVSEELGEHRAASVVRVLARGRGLRPSLSRIALAAYRLDPSDRSRVQLAQDGLRLGRPRQAMRLLQPIVRGSSVRDTRAGALETLAVAHTFLGDARAALACYDQALEIGPRRYPAVCSAFVLAISLSEWGRARALATRLDELARPGSPPVAEFRELRAAMGSAARAHRLRPLDPALERWCGALAVRTGRGTTCSACD